MGINSSSNNNYLSLLPKSVISKVFKYVVVALRLPYLQLLAYLPTYLPPSTPGCCLSVHSLAYTKYSSNIWIYVNVRTLWGLAVAGDGGWWRTTHIVGACCFEMTLSPNNIAGGSVGRQRAVARFFESRKLDSIHTVHRPPGTWKLNYIRSVKFRKLFIA